MVKPIWPEKVKTYILQHKKIAVAGVILLAVISILYFKLSSDKKPTLLTQKVTYGDIKQVVSCTGVVQPVQSVNLTFKNSGLLEKIMVHEGDKVTAGQILATQATSDYEIKVAQAEASLENAQANLSKMQQGTRPELIAQAKADLDAAEANLTQQKNNYDREKKLYDAGAEPLANLQQSETAYKVAEQNYQSAKAKYEQQVNGNLPQDIAAAQAQVKSSTAQLQATQNDLNSTKITAPFEGYISLINGETGQWTPGGAPPNSTGSTMFYITLVSKELELSCQVNEADIGHLKIGQSATFTVNAYPNKTFTATVKSIAPQATTVSNVQMFNVILSIPESDLLKAGMPVNVSITTETRNHVLKVPVAALNFSHQYNTGTTRDRTNGAARERANGSEQERAGGSEQVLVLKDGTPRRVRITTGLKDDIAAEVIQGLQEGDEVVIGSSTPGNSGSGQNRNSQTNQRTPGMPGLSMPRIRS